jgi:hypothetical protein
LLHAGLDWSEELVFGLASGLWFLAFRADGMSPSRFFIGRSGLFEQHFAANTGLELAEETTRDVVKAVGDIKTLIDAGKPVLLKADIRYLPYYATETEFNGHKIVCAGYDDEADEVLVADTHFEGLQQIRFEDLRRTLTSTGAPLYFPDCVYGPVLRSARERPLRDAVESSLATTAKYMLHDPSEMGGLTSMAEMAEELPSWRTRSDAKWIARFSYQVIEKRGTGGALFRRMYTRFLREAGTHADVRASWVEEMTRAAELWTSVAELLKRASEGEDAAWQEAGARAREVAAKERALFEQIEQAFA